MPAISWFASFIFLGLSVSIGLLIYLLVSRKKKGEEDEQLLPPELRNISKDTHQDDTVEDLEHRYKKKG